MQFFAIILMSVFAAVLYGIVHDQVTARICVEYFTIGHPPIFNTNDPTLLGFGWGVIATWWAGLILGVPLAMAARIGKRPKLTVRNLIKPISVLLLVMAVCAVIAGVIGGIAAGKGWVILLEPLASRIPTEKHTAFLIDAWAHSASYFVAFVGSIVLCIRVVRLRRRISKATTHTL